MSKTKIGIIAGLVALIIIIIIVLVRNSKKAKLKEEMEEINVRFNEVKSSPIAYKLSKAQSLAKRNEETAEEVKSYYKKYEKVQEDLDSVQKLIEELEDCIALGQGDDIKDLKHSIYSNISSIQKEIREIDSYLDNFTVEENNQRSSSLKLKEEFQQLKLYISENAGSFTYAIDGVDARIAKVEDLFTESEECLYASDFNGAKQIFTEIETEIDDMKEVFITLPELIARIKGTLPTLIEEAEKEYSLTKQRGINLEKYNIDSKIADIRLTMNADLKSLLECKTDEVGKNCEESEETLKGILADLERENSAYGDAKEVVQNTRDNVAELKRLFEYVTTGYKKDKERFGMEDIEPYLKDVARDIKDFEKRSQEYDLDLSDSRKSSMEILTESNNLYNETEVTRKSLLSHKMKIDKTTSDEQHAKVQLQKLQVVINEVEIKVKEYRIPTISENYYMDLEKSREYISSIKALLEEVPIDVEKLNATVNEAVDSIYHFYNNVNNIVGMAVMIENAIVFGNKYRSTYKEVDQELSKAEFCYINGEYTKSLTTAIKCLEKLYPNISDKKMLENE